ncbi:uncharacterized protein LOC133870568 [Alnus glutinosa]|uniref:uncharacterized protein LOC133870568 n=1 Tax=Alnus glutinosa TaxID=3517 RepID=UPI002D775F24|nr:uncharacterized protein LOC133870568 [Alnus glutinosa]
MIGSKLPAQWGKDEKTLERGKIKFHFPAPLPSPYLSLKFLSVQLAPSPVAGRPRRPSSVSSPSGRQILSSSLSLSGVFPLSGGSHSARDGRPSSSPSGRSSPALSLSGASRSARFGRPSSSPSGRSFPALSLSLRRFSSLRRSLSASGVRPSLRRSLSASGVLCRPADLVPVQLCLRQIFSPAGRFTISELDAVKKPGPENKEINYRCYAVNYPSSDEVITSTLRPM